MITKERHHENKAIESHEIQINSKTIHNNEVVYLPLQLEHTQRTWVLQTFCPHF